MNKVILMGRLTREPEVRYTQGDNAMAIAKFSLAVDRRGRRDNNSDNSQTADFINCTAFGKLGEFAERYLHKGTKVVAVGRIQTGSYTNREGQKVYTTDVVLDEIEFAESKNVANNNQEDGFGAYQAPARMVEPSNAVGDGFMNISDGVDDEGLPFN